MIIVVEGKNDKNKILNCFPHAFVLITNGSAISNNIIEELKQKSVTEEIVLCLDPDGPGEKIRKTIQNAIPSCKNVYAEKAKAISKNHKKVGIEHMSKSDIKSLFSNVYTPQFNNHITYMDLYKLGLMDSKEKRNELCHKLHFGYCNAKQLLKRVNMYNISYEEIRGNI